MSRRHSFITVLKVLFVFALVLGISFAAAGTAAKAGTKAAELEKSEITLAVGDSAKLYIYKYADVKVKWRSSDKSVATVTAKGIVRGKGEGEATITATVAGEKYKCEVTVRRKTDEDASPSVYVKSSITEKHYAIIDDNYVNCSISIPVVTVKGNKEASKKINAIFKEVKNGLLKEAKDIQADMAETAAENDDYRADGAVELTYDVIAHRGNLLFIEIDEYINRGGAHPSDYIVVMPFNLLDGKVVPIEKAFDMSDAFVEAFVNGAEESLAEYEYEFTEEDVAAVEEAMEESSWYYRGGEFVFVIPSETAFPHAFGTVEFGIESSVAVPFLTDYAADIMSPAQKELKTTLDTNPATGYQWSVDMDKDGIVKQVGESEYISDNDDPMMVGVGGSETWTFKGMKEGTVVLTFTYLAPDGSTNGGEEISFVIKVCENKEMHRFFNGRIEYPFEEE